MKVEATATKEELQKRLRRIEGQVRGVQKMIDGGEPLHVVLAALTLCTIPSIVILVAFQRTLVRGIAYTGMYG